MSPREFCFAGQDPWCDALVARFDGVVREAIATRGEASLLVSGGNTPQPLFERLATADWDWSRVHVTLADERWVPADHPHSNERLVRSTLLADPKTSGARFTGLYTGDALPGAAGPALEARLAEVPRPFDLVLLGMGADGHTASLFPGQPETVRAFSEHCEWVANEAPDAPRERISLGPATLLDTRLLVFLLRGAEKWDVYRMALQDKNVATLPAGFFLRAADVPVEVYWSSR